MIGPATGVSMVKMVVAEEFVWEAVEINGDGINMEIDLIKLNITVS